MAEPITIAGVVIGGLVSAYKAYSEYKAAVAKTAEAQQPKPAQSAQAAQGAQAAPIIKAGVAQHGDAKEQTTLQLFEDDPATYQEALQKVLERMAARSQPFAQQLQTLAQQANIQTGGVQGSVNVTGQGKVYGTAAGVVTGSVTGSYTFTDDDEQNKGDDEK